MEGNEGIIPIYLNANKISVYQMRVELTIKSYVIEAILENL